MIQNHCLCTGKTFYQGAENNAALNGTFKKAASGKDIKQKISPEWKTNMRNHMQMTGVRDGAPGIRGTMWG
jgi:hypothetical protein